MTAVLVTLAHARHCRRYAIRARELAQIYQARGNDRMARVLLAIADSFAREARGADARSAA